MLQPVPSVYRGSTLLTGLQISGDSSNMLSSTEFPRLSLLLPNCRKEGGGWGGRTEWFLLVVKSEDGKEGGRSSTGHLRI